ncbi:hypothetical protein BT96DRAFT_991617 [Gymnopus androsaceus JB14]|uniref:F-box domain-containing protein n=1 Tax=Gymnopus androsaceus JB14 TaxID=1447944 RepID=A0A6A4HU43_9AGAR|nr:hypothetical protein BT96DRAFT_991617 [Gymnopus androsaceus JB14]
MEERIKAGLSGCTSCSSCLTRISQFKSRQFKDDAGLLQFQKISFILQNPHSDNVGTVTTPPETLSTVATEVILEILSWVPAQDRKTPSNLRAICRRLIWIHHGADLEEESNSTILQPSLLRNLTELSRSSQEKPFIFTKRLLIDLSSLR